jgi:hypothetical protein
MYKPFPFPVCPGCALAEPHFFVVSLVIGTSIVNPATEALHNPNPGATAYAKMLAVD